MSSFSLTNNCIPQHQLIPKSSTFSQPDKITRNTKIKHKIYSKLQKEGYNIQQKGYNIQLKGQNIQKKGYNTQTYQPIHHLNSPSLIYQQNKKLKINQHYIKQYSKFTHNLKNQDHPNQQQLTTDSQQPILNNHQLYIISTKLLQQIINKKRIIKIIQHLMKILNMMCIDILVRNLKIIYNISITNQTLTNYLITLRKQLTKNNQLSMFLNHQITKQIKTDKNKSNKINKKYKNIYQ